MNANVFPSLSTTDKWIEDRKFCLGTHLGTWLMGNQLMTRDLNSL